MTKKEELQGVLSPIDTLTEDDCMPEWEKLKGALKDDRVTNIAITSSYGMGKTSFLKSFFKKEYSENNQKKYKFISVPNFTSTSQQDAETKLEQNIINQLLFTVNSKKYPYSRIGRIKRYNPIFTWSVFIALWIVAICYLYLNSIFEKSKNLGIFIFCLVIIVVLSGLIYNFIVHLLSKITFGVKSKLGPVELSASIETGKNEENLFIRYGDELVYYFQKSKVKFLILEDMDRFSNPEIFQNLRALNKVLNESLENNSFVSKMRSSWLGSWLFNRLKDTKLSNCINQNNKIKFIYTLSDSVFDVSNDNDSRPSELIDENFAAKQKAKFFDYIISIVPFNNLNVTKRLFEDELDKYNKNGLSKGSVDSNLIFGISSFITDKREIISIVSDMDTYIQKLQRKDQDSIDCNKLFAAMVYKNVYPIDFDNISKGKSKLDYLFQNINKLQKYIDNASDEDEDFQSYLYSKEYMNEKNLKNVISVLLDDRDEFLEAQHLPAKLLTIIEYVKSSQILRYLLVLGYIDLDFYEYVSPTQFDSLSTDEVRFIQNVLIRAIDYRDFKTTNLDGIISVLDAVGANYEYVFSSSILVQEIKVKNQDKFKYILNGAKNRKGYSIIFEVIKELDSQLVISTLGHWLIENWIECFNITSRKKNEIQNTGNYAEAMSAYVFKYLSKIRDRSADKLLQWLFNNNQLTMYIDLMKKQPDSDEFINNLRNQFHLE